MRFLSVLMTLALVHATLLAQEDPLLPPMSGNGLDEPGPLEGSWELVDSVTWAPLGLTTVGPADPSGIHLIPTSPLGPGALIPVAGTDRTYTAIFLSGAQYVVNWSATTASWVADLGGGTTATMTPTPDTEVPPVTSPSGPQITINPKVVFRNGENYCVNFPYTLSEPATVEVIQFFCHKVTFDYIDLATGNIVENECHPGDLSKGSNLNGGFYSLPLHQANGAGTIIPDCSRVYVASRSPSTPFHVPSGGAGQHGTGGDNVADWSLTAGQPNQAGRLEDYWLAEYGSLIEVQSVTNTSTFTLYFFVNGDMVACYEWTATFTVERANGFQPASNFTTMTINPAGNLCAGGGFLPWHHALALLKFQAGLYDGAPNP